MRSRTLFRLLFVVYCVEAGTLLLLLPWSAGWDRMIMQLPWDAVRSVALHPWLRSALTAFGLLHLLWGAHDLDLWLAGRRAREAPGAGSRSVDRP